ncbi:non-ribosomal peptide synthetase [Photobacterium lutimaris]|nr:non-ribosomal peptide synthetase [Photobacterium lutimaris]
MQKKLANTGKLTDSSTSTSFPLGEMQEAYLIGKKLGLGTDPVGCHMYYEFHFQNLDTERLKNALTKVVERHEMLRTLINSNNQELKSEFSIPNIEVFDKKNDSIENIHRHIAHIRNNLSHKVYSISEWPLMTVKVTHLSEVNSLIHFSIDGWIVDGKSLRILFQEWYALYENPTVKQPTLNYRYRQFLKDSCIEECEKKEAEKYWLTSLSDIPRSPFLSINTQSKGCRRTRIKGGLGSTQWDALKKLSNEIKVSPTVFIYTLFTETIRLVNGGDDFAILMTLYNRKSTVIEIDKIIGPFISTNIIETLGKRAENGNIDHLSVLYQQKVWDNLDHSQISGIEILKLIKANKAVPRKFSIPIVFTSLIGESISNNPEASMMDHQSFGVSQTPQIYFDHQIEEKNGTLIFTWDVLLDVFQPNEIENLFKIYNRVLAVVAKEPETVRLTINDIFGQTINKFSLESTADMLEHYSYNSLQKAYLYHRIRNPDKLYPLVYQEVHIKNLDKSKLVEGFRKLLVIHPVLNWDNDSNEGIQQLTDAYYDDLTLEDLSMYSDVDQKDKLVSIRKSESERRFDKKAQPYIHLSVTKINKVDYLIHITVDMMLVDLNSAYHIINDFITLYYNPSEALCVNRKFLQHAHALNESNHNASKSAENYWETKFKRIPRGAFNLIKESTQATKVRQSIIYNHYRLLESVAWYNGLDIGVVLFTAFMEAILRENDNTPTTVIYVNWISGNAQTQRESGEYTFLSWITSCNKDLSFLEKAKQYQLQLNQDESNYPYSGLDVLSKMGMENTKDPSFPLVFTNLISAQKQGNKCEKLGYASTQTPDVFLDNVTYYRGDDLEIGFDFIKERFDGISIKKILTNYKKILERFVVKPFSSEVVRNQEIDHINQAGTRSESSDSVSPSSLIETISGEKNKLLYEWNDTKTPYDSSKLMHQFFEEQAALYPEKVATVSKDSEMTFGEIESMANRLACHLEYIGIKPRQFVGVCLDRSHQMIITLFAIHKLGAAYIPIETFYPRNRVVSIVETASLKHVVTQDKHIQKMDGLGLNTISLDQSKEEIITRDPTIKPKIKITSEDISYVIFTSGSTGKPKGVVVQHRPVINLIEWAASEFSFSNDDYGIFVSALGFDLSVFDIYGILGMGGKLFIVSDEQTGNPEALSKIITDHEITFWNSTPATLNLIVPYLQKKEYIHNTALKTVFLSGDWLPVSLPDAIKDLYKDVDVISLGGATEATVWSNFYRVGEVLPEWKSIPYGKPINNAKYYVLDSNMQPQPIGVEGDLYIGGDCLSMGYLNAPEITNKSFLPNPFEGSEGETLYRTGDLAKYYPDGNLEFLGRSDFQVKIRGYRIELGEIEHCLRKHPAIKDVIVVVKEATPGDQKLISYYIKSDMEQVSSRELRDFAKKDLSAYMVPNLFCEVSTFPLTSNGKIDRKALPFPLLTKSKVEEKSSFLLQSTLLTLIKEELNVEDIPLSEDIFELGATSLNIINVVQKFNQEYPQISLTADLFLEQFNIAGIVEHLDKQVFVGDLSQAVSTDNKDDQLKEYLVDVFKQELNLDDISIEEDFFDRGATSINVINVIERIAQDKSLSVSLEAVLDDSSIQGIVNSFSELDMVVIEPQVVERTQKEDAESLPNLLNVLDLFRAYGENKNIYHYPEFGGTQPIQVFVQIHSESKNRFSPGGYYYNPIEHRLVQVSDRLPQQMQPLGEYTIYFVGESKSLSPLYGKRTPQLLLLSFGYVLETLFEKAAELEIGLCSVKELNRELMRDYFGLEASQVCIDGFTVSTDLSEAESFSNDDKYCRVLDQLNYTQSNVNFFSKSEREEFYSTNPHIFKPRHILSNHKLLTRKLANTKLYTEAMRADWDARPVSLRKLLGLLGEGNYSDFGPLRLLVSINTNMVDEISSGIYEYNYLSKELIQVNKEQHVTATAHYPFYRQFSQSSAFSVYVVIPQKLLDSRLVEYYHIKAARFSKGLAQYQNKSGIKLYPIGDVKFEKVASILPKNENYQFIHCLFGGSMKMLSETCSTNKLKNQKTEFAIIGMSGRYPQSDTPDEFWDALLNKKQCVTTLEERWGSSQDSTRYAALINNVKRFDSLFFNISPAEAKTMDPQERILLEVVWECIEDAGYIPQALNDSSERVGVFVGATWSDYKNVGLEAFSESGKAEGSAFHSSLANRISHFYDFKGPSIAIDTSCSSGLTALHMACSSITMGDCDSAIVASVNIVSHEYHYELLKNLDLLSNSNESNALSSYASGWVLGEGVGSFLIRGRGQAEQLLDNIHAIIKGTSIGHGGRTSRFWSPNATEQSINIQRTLDRAGVSSDDIDYIELAAPGAPLSDASEFQAIKKVFKHRFNGKKIYIGTVKPNVGHAESASSLAQISKAILQLKHDKIAPTIVRGEISPLVDIKNTPFEINKMLVKCQRKEKPFNILVNSFGGTGTSSHVILEQYKEKKKRLESSKVRLFLFSANSDEELLNVLDQYIRFLNKNRNLDVINLAYTLLFGRAELPHRFAVFADNIPTLVDRMLNCVKNRVIHERVVNSEAFSIGIDSENNLVALATEWVEGKEIAKHEKFTEPYKKVSLPTYPFLRNEHWLNDAKFSNTNSKPVNNMVPPSNLEGDVLSRTESYLIQLFSEASEIPEAQINANTTLDKYGINSIIIQSINEKLSQYFRKLSKTLLFEYQTISSLALYLTEACFSELQDMLSLDSDATKYQPSKMSKKGRDVPALLKHDPKQENVVLVGLSGIYPNSENMDEFWCNLKQGVDCISDIPKKRWELQSFKAKNKDEQIDYNRGGFINHVDTFDPLFFGISPKEAMYIDPQERLFLQESWKSLEDAGLTKEIIANDLNNELGVFVGVTYGEYQLHGIDETNKGNQISLGSFYGSVAHRVSYYLGATGPSMAIDTMCASSLTSMHLAAESIRRGECSAAIIGGVNLSLHPNKFVFLTQASMLSAKGQCTSFGKDGGGYVPGEGIGAVVAIKESIAKKLGCHIYATLKGSSINHGGKTNGYYVPNPNAQAELIKAALSQANVNPETITYVEAHGTGTKLGDPIEISGLKKAYEPYTSAKQYCAIGSVKSNIGHLEAAAGIAGVTKVLLQMKHRKLVPSLHSQETNPNIDFEDSPFYVSHDLKDWSRLEGEQITDNPLRASVSSFGAGGANAHVILEEYQQPRINDNNKLTFEAEYPFILSAKTNEQLKVYVGDWLQFLQSRSLNQQTSSNHTSLSLLKTINLVLEEASQIMLLPREELDMDEPFVDQGFSYFALQTLLDKINRIFSLDLSMQVFRKYQNVGAIARYIVEDSNQLSTKGAENSQEISNLVYTLICGREHMDYRFACKFSSLDELGQKLADYMADKVIGDIFVSKTKPSDNIVSNLTNISLNEKLQAWVIGNKIDWSNGQTELKGKRVSLPTYPFAREQYWIPQGVALQKPALASNGVAKSLITELCGTRECPKSIVELRHDEFYLMDHVLGKEHILPGVAFIEMAFQTYALTTLKKKVELNNIVWVQPIKCSQGEEKIRVNYSEEQGRLNYTISSYENSGLIHGQGQIGKSLENEELPEINIANEFVGLNQRISHDECYASLQSQQLNLGSSFKVIREISTNGKKAIGKLSLNGLADTANYHLHPTLLDGALQTAIVGLNVDLESGLFVPFALKSVKIYNKIPSECYAITKTISADSMSRKFSVEIVDMQGHTVLSIVECTSRLYRQNTSERIDDHQLLCKPVYTHEPVSMDFSVKPLSIVFTSKERAEKHGSSYSNTRFIVLENGISENNNVYYFNGVGSPELNQFLTSLSDPISMIWWDGIALKSLYEYMDDLVEHEVLDFLELYKKLVSNTIETSLFYSFSEDKSSLPVQSSIKGLINSLQKETTKINYCSISFQQKLSFNKLFNIISSEVNRVESHKLLHLHYEGTKRHVRNLVPIDKVKANSLAIKRNGVYLITGAFGGLAKIFAQYLFETYQVQLVLTDLAEGIAEDDKVYHQLEERGCSIRYRKCDLSQPTEVKSLFDGLTKLDGILHCAGIIDDGYAHKKERRDFRRVIQPKMNGTIYLEKYCINLDVDFIVLFSSMASELGNQGQSDYCYANSFLNEFSRSREKLYQQGIQNHRTISINWPLWKNGGLKVDAEVEKYLESSMKMRAISNKDGLNVFEQSLYYAEAETMVLNGDKAAIQTHIMATTALAKTKSAPLVLIDKNETSRVSKVIEDIVIDIAAVPRARLDVDDDLNNYGFDSISFTSLANRINTAFSINITPALFFELQVTSIKGITTELTNQFPESFIINKQPPKFVPDHQEGENKPIEMTPPTQKSLPVSGKVEEDIAIVGMSGVLPNSASLDEFWNHLVEGNNLVSEIPEQRWKWKDYYGDPNKEIGKTNIKWGAFMPDIDMFDAEFFNISPREAVLMDPQQRKFLETVWNAIEHSGHSPKEYSNTRTGLFVGVSTSEYSQKIKAANLPIDAYTSTGSCHSITANRISYLLNLRGPSEPVDTACSSSLVAIIRAIEYIKKGECDCAIVGGVNALISPDYYISFNKAGMLSEDGKCKTFDENADGYVRGEGSAALILKPISKAEADNDTIYGVIKGSAINHGGHANSLTAPNAQAQADLLTKAYSNAEIDPNTITYIEAHGTGTRIGDPIEINGIKKAFATLESVTKSEVDQPLACGIGSVKTNTGHLETAAGITGLIKILYAMNKGVIPASIHQNKKSSYIELDNTKFYIVDKNTAWKTGINKHGQTIPKRAGISSFGFGGVNAHLVIEEYRGLSSEVAQEIGDQLVVLSAKSTAALYRSANNLDRFVAENQKLGLADIAYTTRVRDAGYAYRLAIIVNSLDDLREKLKSYLIGDGKYGSSIFYNKQLEPNQTILRLLEGPEGEEFTKILVGRNKVSKLAQLWVDGAGIDILLRRYKRVGLPGYPFEKESYWIKEDVKKHANNAVISAINPLIHKNTSTLSSHQYESTFNKDDFFLKDHRLNGVSILPGVVSIGMMGVALENALPDRNFVIRDTNWLRPLFVDEDNVNVYVRIKTNSTSFSISVFTKETDGNEVVHVKAKIDEIQQSVAGRVDIAAIEALCSKELNVDQQYRETLRKGLNLGSSFKVINKIKIGSGMALARLKLADSMDLFDYHPSLLDGALQSAILSGNFSQLCVPYEVKAIERFRPLTRDCWVYIEEQTGSNCFNISITDPEGNLLVKIHRFYPQVIQDEKEVTSELAHIEAMLIECADGRRSEEELKAELDAL